jgi:hypothetical protein
MLAVVIVPLEFVHVPETAVNAQGEQMEQLAHPHG